MARKEFKLPDTGEGLTEAEILHWHVKPGDEVSASQTIVDIETAKAAVELPCPYDGTVAEVLVEEGQTVEVGTPIIAFEVAGAGGEPAPAGDEQAAEAVPDNEPDRGTEERQAVLVGYGPRTGPTRRRPRKPHPGGPAGTSPARSPQGGGPSATPSPSPGPAPRVGSPPGPPPAPPPGAASHPAAHPPTPGQAPASAPAGGKEGPERRSRVTVLAKPPVRKLAKDLGVDLRGVLGSGEGGVITRADVEAAAETAQAPARGVTFDPARERRIPIRGVTRHMAAAMVRSAFTAPHVTEFLTIDMTATVEATALVKAVPEFAETRVSPLLLVAKALLLAVGRHPLVNATWDEQGEEIVVKEYVNLGIAVATQRGLLVPNVKGAESMTLSELARALNDLADTARAGKTPPADMQGGTISITNVGIFGVDTGTPIINPGEAAILSTGAIRDMPWVHEGEVKPRKVATLSLSFDHRLVDGELGSQVLADIGAMLEDPTRMIAWG